MSQVARETGVSYATFSNWIGKYPLAKLDVDDATGMTPDQQNPGEKSTLRLENKTLDEVQKGEWVTLRAPPVAGTGVDHRDARPSPAICAYLPDGRKFLFRNKTTGRGGNPAGHRFAPEPAHMAGIHWPGVVRII